MLSPRPFVVLSLLLAPASLLRGQAQPARAMPAPAVSLEDSCGVQVEDGTLWGLGRDYKARFLDDGIEFTPALGATAPHNLPLRFRLLEIGRRGQGGVAAPAAVAPRSVEGRHVRYQHGDVTEAYEVRPEGVAQSFVFAALPAGDGDLVVRGAITTELDAVPSGDGSGAVQFLRPGLGGVRIGAVTGIDARGRRVAGGLRFADGVLELSLPAAFLAQAALPLVLDPLLGTTVTVAAGLDEKEPDAACIWVSSAHVYLVVWARVFSSGDVDIRGHRLDNVGALLGGLLGIRTNTSLVSDQPRVAPVKLRDRYVVVWRERVGTSPSTIAACSVDSMTGAVSTATQLVAGTDAFAAPDVGGDNESLDDTAIAVWADVTLGQIEGARIVVLATGAVTSLGRRIVAATGRVYHSVPAISQDCGPHGRFLLAWQSSYAGVWVSGLVASRTFSTLESLTLTDTTGPLESAPDVSGDGLHWMVAYDRRLDSASAPDLYARWVTFEPMTSACYLGTEANLSGASGNDTGAAVALMDNSALVSYRLGSASTVYGGFVRSLDWFSCVPCEGFYILESNGVRDVRRVASTARYRDGLLAWESVDPATGTGEVRARRFGEGIGQSASLPNSACGPDVQVHAGCPRSGHLGFHLRLEHAEPGRPVFLLMRPSLGFPAPDLTCGSSCGLLDPFRSWFFPAGVTDAHGNAAVPLPIPSTAPAQALTFQFGIQPSGAAACPALGLSFSRLGYIFLY